MTTAPVYLGDGCTVEMTEYGQVVLRAGKQAIVLEPEVIEALQRWLQKVGK